MKRREFLGTGIAAGAGVLLASGERAGAQATAPSDALNVALIGVGAHGRALLNTALLIQGIRFRAVCDIWDQCCKFAQYYLRSYRQSINTYADYREMLEKEKGLQAVMVATPDFMHAEQANACLQAGLHVYCETPMSSSLEGARSMVRTMRQTGKLLQIGYQRRSNPRYLHVHQNLLQKAKLPGRLTHVDAQWTHRVSEAIGWPKNAAMPDEVLRRFGYASMHELRNWRWFRKFSAGLFPDFGSHQVDVANWFLGVTPKSVIAGGGVDYYNGSEWHDNVMAILEYPAGAPRAGERPGVVRALCRVLTTTSGSGNCEAFIGTDGAIRISEEPKWTKVYREPHAPDWEQWTRLNYLSRKEDASASKPLTSEEAHARETGVLVPYDLPVAFDKPLHQPHLDNFFEAIRGKAKLNCPADEAFRTEAVASKVTEALEARKMLQFAPADFVV
jgi:predicted dehydrogenase